MLHLGIDYSGASHRHRVLSRPSSAIVLAELHATEDRLNQSTPAPSASRLAFHSRASLTALFIQRLAQPAPRFLAGFDFGFSLPQPILHHLGVHTWDELLAFLLDISSFFDFDSLHIRDLIPLLESLYAPALTTPDCSRRLCEQTLRSTKSTVNFRAKQGNVAYATHAGLLEFAHLFHQHPHLRQKVHIWPFDGFQPPPDKHIFFEAYPALYKKLVPDFPQTSLTPDQQDATLITTFLKEALPINPSSSERKSGSQVRATSQHFVNFDQSSRGQLLSASTPTQHSQIQKEGWILGLPLP